jgi:hypothetical protein
VEVEYFFDTDPGIGNGSKLPVTPATNIVGTNYNINVTGLAAGVHRLYIRSRDAQGKWSLTGYGMFDNTAIQPYPSAPLPAGDINKMEYFIDIDPGFGNGIAINTTPGIDINNLAFNVPVGGLPDGPHYFYIRSKEQPFSLTTIVPFTIGATLPVNWLYVRGLLITNGANIEWATAQESNTDRYIVEYSATGAAWQAVGEVKAAGNSETSRKYSFLHTATQNGFNYYRIRQLDKDGRFTYSKMITLLQQNGLTRVVLSPNPATDQVNLAQPFPVRVRQVQVRDRQGKLVIQQNYDQAAVSVVSIPVSVLAPGVYMLTLYTDRTTQVFRFIKE